MLQNVFAIGIGCFGAWVAYMIHLPIWVLTGPALAVSIAGLAGVSLDISGWVRQAAFLMMGLGVGTGVTPEAASFLFKTPPAFALLIVMLLVIIIVCHRALLWMGYSNETAILASAPGHLSFVLALAEDKGANAAEIGIIQMIRILFLMFSIPVIVLALGIPISRDLVQGTVFVPLLHIPALVIAGLALGVVFIKWKFPAALVLSGMAVSAVAQLSGLTTGIMPAWITLPAFGIIGCLIGTRFSGVSPRTAWRYLGTGLTTTALTMAVAVVFAAIAAWILDVPLIHTLISMAPGGLETMVSMGDVLGANSSFVAAMHVWRLVALTFIVPITLRVLR